MKEMISNIEAIISSDPHFFAAALMRFHFATNSSTFMGRTPTNRIERAFPSLVRLPIPHPISILIEPKTTILAA